MTYNVFSGTLNPTQLNLVTVQQLEISRQHQKNSAATSMTHVPMLQWWYLF